ncbi:MAG: DUF3899 domain-containing protein [Candidatus Izemoplasmatales bacterium]|jgi:hypothetical protein|nr:DUF3899 domain-containing protein [Candidatus Izemoplasmatales bacterium]
MLKKLLFQVFLDLVGGSLAVLILMFAFFGWDFRPQEYNLSTSFFIIGLIMFSAGILTVTGATKIFRGIGFVFKRMFTRKVEGMSYYEYILMKEEAKEKAGGLPLFIAGIIFIVIAVIIG